MFDLRGLDGCFIKGRAWPATLEIWLAYWDCWVLRRHQWAWLFPPWPQVLRSHLPLDLPLWYVNLPILSHQINFLLHVQLYVLFR